MGPTDVVTVCGTPFELETGINARTFYKTLVELAHKGQIDLQQKPCRCGGSMEKYQITFLSGGR